MLHERFRILAIPCYEDIAYQNPAVIIGVRHLPVEVRQTVAWRVQRPRPALPHTARARAGPAHPHMRPTQRESLLMPYTIPAAPTASRRRPCYTGSCRTFLDTLARTHRVPRRQLALDTGTDVIAVHTGTADTATGSPFTADTAVPLGSLTKPCTAALVMLLADDGDLDLDRARRPHCPPPNWAAYPT
ncbi:beta-lactamase family protein [Streptomyces tricolor]|nr:beta-lactamase family protein [Streptomyces tricolor]